MSDSMYPSLSPALSYLEDIIYQQQKFNLDDKKAAWKFQIDNIIK